MAWWDENAIKLEREVRIEANKIDQDFGEREVRRAIVHARQDIVLMVAHLSSLNRQIATAKFILLLILAVLVVIGIKLIA